MLPSSSHRALYMIPISHLFSIGTILTKDHILYFGRKKFSQPFPQFAMTVTNTHTQTQLYGYQIEVWKQDLKSPLSAKIYINKEIKL